MKMVKMLTPASIAVWCLLAAVVVVQAVEVRWEIFASCDPSELRPCIGAIIGNQPPSKVCCLKMKEQVPCFCQYIKYPAFAPYIEKGKKVAAACGLRPPPCH